MSPGVAVVVWVLDADGLSLFGSDACEDRDVRYLGTELDTKKPISYSSHDPSKVCPIGSRTGRTMSCPLPRGQGAL